MVQLFRRKDKSSPAKPSAAAKTAAAAAAAAPPTTKTEESPLLPQAQDPTPPVPPPQTLTYGQSDTVQARLQSKYKRDVVYDEENHLAVICQVYGSVWPKVLPWCLAVMAFTYLLIYLRENDIFDATISDATGHNFMSILVSFLVVTRVTITYNRFMEARQHLQDLFLSVRELIQYTCVLTNQNTSNAAKQWRQDVAYRTIVGLRLAMSALEYRSTGVNAWDVLPDEDHAQTPLMLDPQNDAQAANYRPNDDVLQVARALQHGPRTTSDENFRAPVVWTLHLREAILQPRVSTKILAQRDWHVNESLKLMAITSSFMSAFHGLKKLITTPFPFPLIQLNRIFLFAWCFSLPLVLIHDNDETIEILILVFFTTFGFLGLEYSNIEMEDPFGTDPNDFPSTRWAESVYEDIYITIYKTDGYQSAMNLRSRITERIARGNALQNYQEEASRKNFWTSFKH